MKSCKKSFFIISILASFVILSCKEKSIDATTSQSPEPNLPVLPKSAKDHSWFAFANGGFVRATLPQNSPIQSMKPWTESVRISAGGSSFDGNGYLLVNHIGALVFEQKENPTIINDKILLSNSTASNLVFSNNDAFFTLSKNPFFNKFLKDQMEESNRPYLVRISPENKIIYPCVTYGDLQLEKGEEVVNSYFDGEKWVSAIKKDGKNNMTNEDAVIFRYISWSRLGGDYSSLPAKTRTGDILINEETEESYLKAISPVSFSKAPPRLRSLLSSIPDSFDFNINVGIPGGVSPTRYAHGDSTSSTEARAIIADSWICAIFADGTTYFCGSINDGKRVLNNGQKIAFRLPKLPKNYFYTDFCLSGDILVIGWEENDFYKTGRSGFLTVRLNELF